MARQGQAWRGEARRGQARQGAARHGLARRGKAGHGTAGQGMARLLMTKILTGWKAIADYLGVAVSTVKRYYKIYGLPVKRTPSNRPYAIADEIIFWLDENEPKIGHN